jgi:outer membrane PBP1 activator LpoA protein
MFEDIARRYGNEIWMKYRAADAYFKADEFDKAAELVRQVNERKPTVDTLLLEAKLKRRKKDFPPAITLLEEAERILEGKELVWI